MRVRVAALAAAIGKDQKNRRRCVVWGLLFELRGGVQKEGSFPQATLALCGGGCGLKKFYLRLWCAWVCFLVWSRVACVFLFSCFRVLSKCFRCRVCVRCRLSSSFPLFPCRLFSLPFRIFVAVLSRPLVPFIACIVVLRIVSWLFPFLVLSYFRRCAF